MSAVLVLLERVKAAVAAWPAPVRHLVLLILSVAGAAVWELARTGETRPSAYVAAVCWAVGAVLTPLIQSYGLGRAPADPAEVPTSRYPRVIFGAETPGATVEAPPEG